VEDKRFEYIILYVLAGCVSVIIAAFIRLSALKLGLDNFTANVIFLIFIALAIVAYLSIQLVLQNLMIPLIKKLLMKIPYSCDKTKPEFNLLNTEEIRKNNADEKEKKLNDAIHRIFIISDGISGIISRLENRMV
jgi:hypothetical protein